jgi:hypothetical protein
VRRCWYCRDDAVTVANSCMGSCGWFVPSCGQLQNPGYTCRTYWNSYCNEIYWSSSEYNLRAGWWVDMSTGVTAWDGGFYGKNNVRPIRAFRCTLSWTLYFDTCILYSIYKRHYGLKPSNL